MTPEQWRDEIGEKVRARRENLGFHSVRAAAKRALVNEATWRQVESGRRQVAPGHVIAPSPSEATVAKMAVPLAWDRGWLDDLKAGQEPRALSDLAQYLEEYAAWGFDHSTPPPTPPRDPSSGGDPFADDVQDVRFAAIGRVLADHRRMLEDLAAAVRDLESSQRSRR